jgi:adenylylsulfate kinase
MNDHGIRISREDRSSKNNHSSFVLWFTGLSGSGKTTIAYILEKKLFDLGIGSYVLDGDNLRKGLTSDLGFSDADRSENIRRAAETAKLFVDAGLIAIASFISPKKTDRDFARSLFDMNEFIEIYFDCPIDVCEKRDVKGLYKKYRSGSLKDFTGFDSTYQPPSSPDLTLHTDTEKIEESLDKILRFLYLQKLIK